MLRAPAATDGGGFEGLEPGVATAVVPFAKGDRILYKETGEAVTVLKAHVEEAPYFYYTVRMADGREKQTTTEKLRAKRDPDAPIKRARSRGRRGAQRRGRQRGRARQGEARRARALRALALAPLHEAIASRRRRARRGSGSGPRARARALSGSRARPNFAEIQPLFDVVRRLQARLDALSEARRDLKRRAARADADAREAMADANDDVTPAEAETPLAATDARAHALRFLATPRSPSPRVRTRAPAAAARTRARRS